jgi:hypothetical protein
LRSEVVFSSEEKKLTNASVGDLNKVQVSPEIRHLQLGLKIERVDYKNGFLEAPPRYVQPASILDYKLVAKLNGYFPESLNN